MRTLDPGITNIEIAKHLGLAPRTLNSMIWKATKEGWLKFEDPLSKVEYEIVPKVVNNLNYFLDQKDKQVTIEAAKGTIFRTYQESKGAGNAAQTTVLALKIEMPEGQTAQIAGHIVGKPKVEVAVVASSQPLNGEIIEAEKVDA